MKKVIAWTVIKYHIIDKLVSIKCICKVCHFKIATKKELFPVSFLLSNFPKYQFKEIIPVSIIAGHNSPQYSERHLEFFAMFHNFYLLVPRFQTEPLTMFRGTLVTVNTAFVRPL